MEKQMNVPKLRFTEFTVEWETKEGDTVFESISNKNHNSDLPILAITQEFGAIPRDLIDYKVSVTDKSVESYKIVEKGDFIISLRSFQGGIEYSNFKGICSPAYIILKPIAIIDSRFYKTYFKTDKYIKLLTKNLEGIRDGKMISFKYFSEAKLTFPNLPEQTKIADFLIAVDNKLSQLKKKKSLLEQYKKGVMQKLFSQELRFKDENGNDFAEWEEKKIKDVFRFKQGIQCSVENQYSERGENMQRFIRIIDLTSTNEPIRYIDSPSNEHHIKPDDLFMVRYGTPGLVGFGYEGVIANNLFRIIPVKEVVNKFYYFVFTFLSQELSNLASSSTMPALSFGSLEVLSVPEPSLPEQTKIANFLSAIDDKISHCSMQIEKMEGWKKGLLQGMFV